MTAATLARLATAAAALPTAEGAYTVAWCDGDGCVGCAYCDDVTGVGAGCIAIRNDTLEIVTITDNEQEAA